MSEDIYFFYKGTPYKKDNFCSDARETAGRSVWDNGWIKVPKSEIEICKEEEIGPIFVAKCKQAIKNSMIGWTTEKAKELEENGKKYLDKEWVYYIKECGSRVYKACEEGKYGIIYRLSTIQLPSELKMGNRPCSDGEVRNEKEYIKFLLGEDWSLIRLFMLKWPMLKFQYVDFSKADEPFPDIYCMVPFYDDHKVLHEINNSVLL
jgi:hypothetical protein